MSFFQRTKLDNVAGTTINPATEDSLTKIISTDGVKKITDPLPAGTNLLGKVKVQDSAGHDIVGHQNTDGDWYLGASIIQNAEVVPDNSSSVPLEALAYFVGIAKNTLGVNSIQVTIKADQSAYVWVSQSPGLIAASGTISAVADVSIAGSSTKFLTEFAVGDEIVTSGGTRIVATISSNTEMTVTLAVSCSGAFQRHPWDVSDRFYYNKIADNFSRTTQAVNSYFRVKVQNLSQSTAMTFMRLQSVLCPIAEPVTRATNELGIPQTQVQGISDAHGLEAYITPHHSLFVTDPVRLLGTAFVGETLDPYFWTAATSVGTITQANTIATLTTGTTNGYAQISSVRYARFVSGMANRLSATIRIPDLTETGNIRRWGAYTVSTATPQDGFYFELSAAGELSVVACKAGTPAPVANGTFNGIVSEYFLDTNKHDYEIIYRSASASFYIDDVLVHTITSTTAPATTTMQLPACCSAVGPTTGAEPAVLEVWNLTIYRLGQLATSPTYAHLSGAAANWSLKLGPGRLHKIVFGNTNNTSLTIYDGLSASAPAVVVSVITTATAALGVWDFGITFNTGLFLVTAGNDLDATVIYE